MDQPTHVTERNIRFLKIFSVAVGILSTALVLFILVDIAISSYNGWL